MAFVGQHSRSEAIEYANRLNRSIQSLLLDIHENLVYAHPENLRILAKGWEKIPTLSKQVDELNKKAALLEKRSIGKDESQINKEVDFSSTYQDYVNTWDIFDNKLLNDIIPPVFNWDQLEAFDSEFRQFYILYPKISGSPPSLDPPKTEAEINKEHPNDWSLSNLLGKIPWTPILLVGGAYLLWTNRDSVKAAFTSKSEEPKALPEKTS